MNYVSKAKKAATMIKKAGAVMTLRQITPGEYDPATGEETGSTQIDYPCVGLLKIPGYKDAGVGFEDGSLIKAADKTALIPASGLDAVPSPGDKLVVLSDTWNILLVQTFNPGGVDILHTLYLRKS